MAAPAALTHPTAASGRSPARPSQRQDSGLGVEITPDRASRQRLTAAATTTAAPVAGGRRNLFGTPSTHWLSDERRQQLQLELNAVVGSALRRHGDPGADGAEACHYPACPTLLGLSDPQRKQLLAEMQAALEAAMLRQPVAVAGGAQQVYKPLEIRVRPGGHYDTLYLGLQFEDGQERLVGGPRGLCESPSLPVPLTMQTVEQAKLLFITTGNGICCAKEPFLRFDSVLISPAPQTNPVVFYFDHGWLNSWWAFSHVYSTQAFGSITEVLVPVQDASGPHRRRFFARHGLEHRLPGTVLAAYSADPDFANGLIKLHWRSMRANRAAGDTEMQGAVFDEEDMLALLRQVFAGRAEVNYWPAESQLTPRTKAFELAFRLQPKPAPAAGEGGKGARWRGGTMED